MTDIWLAYAEGSGRRECVMALRRFAPGAAMVFVESAQELRRQLVQDEEPGTVGVIVGHASQGVSDMNLAAAIAHDGRAKEVVLVARGASGSLRSRARRAGISRVFDATVSPLGLAQEAPGLQEAEDAVETGPAEAVGAEKLPASLKVVDGERPSPVAPQADATRPHASVANDASHLEKAGELAKRNKESAPVLTVASGRGGVGKTSLVAMLASTAARWGMEVAVVDLDLSCGNLHTCLGVPTAPDITRIVVDGHVSDASMGRASVRCAEHLHLWGPCGRPEMAEVVMPHVATLISYLSARFDLVLIDTSTTFTDAVAQAVQSCDRMLVVHDERAGAVASAARMSALAVRLGVARTRIVRVVDLADPRAKPNAFEGRAEVGLETARMYRVVDGGIEAEELLTSGKSSELVATSSQLAVGVASLLAQSLSELGRLPDNDMARKAAEERPRRHGLRLFGGQRREAV